MNINNTCIWSNDSQNGAAAALVTSASHAAAAHIQIGRVLPRTAGGGGGSGHPAPQPTAAVADRARVFLLAPMERAGRDWELW